MSFPLHPQVRVDKNGRAVTRHVRETQQSHAKTRRMPVPSVASSSRSSVAHEQRLYAVLENLSTSADASSLDPSIRDTNDDTLLTILEDVSSGLGPEDKSFRKALRHIVRMATPELVEKHLRATAVLKGYIRPDLMLRFIAGMEKSEALRDYADRLNEAPEPVKDAARALAGSIETMLKEEYGVSTGKQFYVKDKFLEAAIIRNPERADEYIRFAKERGSGEALNEIDTAHGAFRGGLL